MLYRITYLKQRNFLLLNLAVIASLAVFCLTARARGWWQQADGQLRVDTQACSYEPALRRLVIRGANFQPGLNIGLQTPAGALAYETLKVVSPNVIHIEGVNAEALQNGVTLTLTLTSAAGTLVNATIPALSVTLAQRGNGRPAMPTHDQAMPVRTQAQTDQLSSAEVEQIIAQAVAQAEAGGLRAVIAVVDAEGRNLGTFNMTGALATTQVGLGTRCAPGGCAAMPLTCGLEGVCVPACAAAISKAVTGSFLSSQGHAFSTRTASFIVQEHFPPGVNFQASGPLYGVQFSQLLCSDVNPKAPLGLAADAGGLPLYKNGVKAGGIGVEGDGRYAFDPNPFAQDVAAEELIALAGARGFEAPPAITGDKIIVNGIRFPYLNAAAPPALTVRPFNQLAGALNTCVGLAPAAVRGSQPSEFVTATLAAAPAGRINTRLFPAGVNSFGMAPDLTRDEVVRILTQAAQQAFITRAAIRQPLNSAAEVNLTVCDASGKILGIFSTIDAPQFGLDVSAQKARTAAFFSNAVAATQLRLAGLGGYADAAARDSLRLDGATAFSDRAVGFLSRPLYPDGIDRTQPGPFSLLQVDFSPFNVGLQLEVVLESYYGNLLKAVAGDAAAAADALTAPCGTPALAAVANGLQIFPGSVPLYKNGKLVGAIGVSGDGVDQDDLISAMGSAGFEAPPETRADQIFVRGARLPYVKFPRQPNRN